MAVSHCYICSRPRLQCAGAVSKADVNSLQITSILVIPSTSLVPTMGNSGNAQRQSNISSKHSARDKAFALASSYDGHAHDPFLHATGRSINGRLNTRGLIIPFSLSYGDRRTHCCWQVDRVASSRCLHGTRSSFTCQDELHHRRFVRSDWVYFEAPTHSVRSSPLRRREEASQRT